MTTGWFLAAPPVKGPGAETPQELGAGCPHVSTRKDMHTHLSRVAGFGAGEEARRGGGESAEGRRCSGTDFRWTVGLQKSASEWPSGDALVLTQGHMVPPGTGHRKVQSQDIHCLLH